MCSQMAYIIIFLKEEIFLNHIMVVVEDSTLFCVNLDNKTKEKMTTEQQNVC